MQTNWQESLKEIKKRISVYSTGDPPPKKQRRVRIRKREATKRHVGLTSRPFAGLGKALEKSKDPGVQDRIVRNYRTIKGETETVMIQSFYSINELEKLISGAGLRNLVARIESFDSAYYQIELVKEPVMGGGKAAQRNRLEILGRVVAHAANGLQQGWDFEEEEDLGYY